jgi:hypothetical protein
MLTIRDIPFLELLRVIFELEFEGLSYSLIAALDIPVPWYLAMNDGD